MLLKRVAMVVIAALGCAAAASAQNSTTASGQATPQSSSPATTTSGAASQPSPRTHVRRVGHAAGDDDVRGGHRPVVRADRGSAAGEEVVAQRLPRELRPRPGLHRRLELAGDGRRSAWRIGPRSSARSRSSAGSTATSGRCSWRRSRGPAAWSTSIRSCGKAGPTTSSGDFTIGAKVNLMSEWRQRPVALAVRGAGEAADREGRRRRGRHREDGLQFRRDPEQGDQPAGRALRLCRLHLARRSVGRRSEQWVPLGHRRRAAVARRTCG